MTIGRKGICLGILALVFAAMQCPAEAAYNYTYTGQPFGAAFNGDNQLPGSTHITVDFTVANLLAPGTSFGFGSEPFASMTMSDGVSLITPSYGTFLSSSFINTDGAGNIASWAIVELLGANRSFQLGNVCCTIGDVPVMYTYSNATDASIMTNGFFGIGPPTYFAYNNQAPGHWSVSGVPEPSTWAMMVIGLGFVGFMLRRGRQKDSVAKT